MNRTQQFAAVAVLSLAVLGAGVYGFHAFADPQKPAPQGTRTRPPEAPSTGQAAPRESRPREDSGQAAPRSGRPPGESGQAVPRTGRPPRPRPGAPGRLVVPYTYGYRYPYPGMTLDFWYGYPYPYSYPLPPGYVFGGPDALSGSMRLDVSPKDAQVYVDGYYAGIVDDFNGMFRHLTLTAGPHVIEIRRAGFEPLLVNVYVQPRRTITYRAAMEPVQPGSAGAQPEADDVAASGGDVRVGPPGDLRLEVTPKDAQVYVDGFYAGIVDDFGGDKQRLNLAPGPYHIELQAPGYKALGFDVNVESGQTVNYRGDLTPVKP